MNSTFFGNADLCVVPYPTVSTLERSEIQYYYSITQEYMVFQISSTHVHHGLSIAITLDPKARVSHLAARRSEGDEKLYKSQSAGASILGIIQFYRVDV